MGRRRHIRLPQLPVKYIFGVLAAVSIFSIAVTMKYKIISLNPIEQNSYFHPHVVMHDSSRLELELKNMSRTHGLNPYLRSSLANQTVVSAQGKEQEWSAALTNWTVRFRNQTVGAFQHDTINQTCLKTPNGSWTDVYETAPWRTGVKDAGPPYLCVGLPGRLGNAMFTFSSSLGLAILTNRTLVVPPNFPLLRHFRLRALVDCDSSRCNSEKTAVVPEKKCCTFDPKLASSASPARSLQVKGYLQSWRYFAHAEGEVRRQLTAHGRTARQAAISIARIRLELDSDVTLVGVHVRHDDIVRQRELEAHGYRVPPTRYFAKAMSFFTSAHPKVAFLFATDDVEYVTNRVLPLCRRQNLVKVADSARSFAAKASAAGLHEDARDQSSVSIATNNASTSLREYPQGGVLWNTTDVRLPQSVTCRLVTTSSPAVDLVTLASCDHVIMSVGTFGWWAGWLSGGEVVYYKHPAVPRSVLWQNTKMEDFFPPRWIPMD